MTVDINLPPLPDYNFDDGAVVDRVIQDYARAAIKADRQQRGEPAALAKALRFAEHVRKCLRSDGEYAPLITQDVDEVISALRGTPQPSAPAQEPSDDIDIKDVREYLDAWGCLAHPGVVALLARYGSKS